MVDGCGRWPGLGSEGRWRTAAIGRVEARVPWKSASSLDFGGSVYGMTRGNGQ